MGGTNLLPLSQQKLKQKHGKPNQVEMGAQSGKLLPSYLYTPGGTYASEILYTLGGTFVTNMFHAHTRGVLV